MLIPSQQLVVKCIHICNILIFENKQKYKVSFVFVCEVLCKKKFYNSFIGDNVPSILMFWQNFEANNLICICHKMHWFYFKKLGKLVLEWNRILLGRRVVVFTIYTSLLRTVKIIKCLVSHLQMHLSISGFMKIHTTLT